MSPSRTSNVGQSSATKAGKSHTCAYCRRDFRRLEHLQRHVRLHTKEKPYNCNCGQTFARRDLLKRHQRLAHGGDHHPIPSRSEAPSITSPASEPLHGTVAHIGTPSQRPSPISAINISSTPSIPGYNETAGTPSTITPSTTHLPLYLPPSNQQAVEDNLPVGSGASDALLTTTQESTAIFPGSHNIYDPLEDFATFIDSMGLAFDSESLIDLRSIPLEHGSLSNVSQAGTRVPQNPRPDYDEEQSESTHRAQSPTLLPIPLNPSAVQAAVYMPQLKITEAQRAHLLQSLTPFQHLLPGFTLPSRDSLTRFLNAYFDRVYPHFPFMHGPSFAPEKHPLESILAMTASGAQYRYEHRKGHLLFYASKTVFQERQRQKEAALANCQLVTPPPMTMDPDPYSPSPTIVDDIRCLLNLAIYATWQQDTGIVKGVCDLQSLLVRLLRESGMVEENIPDSDKLDWQTWLQLELDRRVKLFAFAFLNLQSIAYNLPPILLSHEVNLRLPCTCEEWRAVDEANWREARRRISREQSLFQDALAFLIKSKDAPNSIKPIPSPSSSIILLHGLLHRILLSRQASMSGIVPSDQMDIFENALRRWTSTWQLAPESSLDPLNPNGPIPFTSTALLGLAYTRLQLDLGPCRALTSRDPRKIASTLFNSAPLVRNRRLLPALLHATHALSIPVKLGLEYVSRSQAFVWSNQHALCGLEFAVLLSKWLHAVGQSRQRQPLEGRSLHIRPQQTVHSRQKEANRETEHEQRLLNWVRRIVEEGRTSLDDSEDPASEGLDCERLAFFVVHLWARIMRGNAQWPFIDIIGQSLELYACGHDVVLL
ncbi:hypothetical protein BBP40_004630 [Aspergillus hancockii]|nr:hypothetical protein BBP40_004630 [Aspergillus hancockii]